MVIYENDYDVAILQVVDEDGLERGPSVELAEPKLGRVCTHNMVPKDEQKCGYILRVTDERWGLLLSFEVIPGNSGSPLYQDGKLVGVVTARWPWRGSALHLAADEVE